MDPTKNFDHLDPKLKETYARVMGTPTSGSAGSPPPADPSLSATQPNSFLSPVADPNQSVGQNFNQSSEPNPGTGPTINTMPMGATSMLSQPDTTSIPEANTPANSSFFSNPSPATTDPPQPASVDASPSTSFTPPATEPAPVPVTPYSSDGTTSAIPAMSTAEQFSQPLPSPASVAQNAPKESSPLLRVLYIIAAVVFFAIYTVFWIKVFNLPFLF